MIPPTNGWPCPECGAVSKEDADSKCHGEHDPSDCAFDQTTDPCPNWEAFI